MIDKLMENIAHKDRTITQLSEEKQALIVDYLAHARLIAEQEAELARLRAENVAKDAEIERLKAILADALEWGMTSKHFDAGRSLKNGEDARAALSRAGQAKPEPETCVWRGNILHGYKVQCGYLPIFGDGVSTGKCPGCGKRIEVKG